MWGDYRGKSVATSSPKRPRFIFIQLPWYKYNPHCLFWNFRVMFFNTNLGRDVHGQLSWAGAADNVKLNVLNCWIFYENAKVNFEETITSVPNTNILLTWLCFHSRKKKHYFLIIAAMFAFTKCYKFLFTLFHWFTCSWIFFFFLTKNRTFWKLGCCSHWCGI